MTWENLVKIGLIGTNRSKISKEMFEELRSMGIEVEDPAHLILKAAATMSMTRKAGRIPAEFTEDLPVPIEKIPSNICSKRAILYLNRIIKRNDLQILVEFITTLKKYNKSLPPESLPLILDKALKTPVLWKALKLDLGDREKWLITQNPNWSTLIHAPTLTDWENGNTEARTKFLKYKRSVDPSAALSLLEETWPQENISTRKKLLKALDIGLSLTDDTFLSNCLKEKHKGLRKTAIHLLSQIPNSSFNKRMVFRLKKLIKLKKSGNQSSLEIKLPKGVDDTMILDGIKTSAQLYGSGNKASQLAQMIKQLPLSCWNDLLETEVTKLLPLVIKNEYAHLLLSAIIDAAIYHKNEVYSKLILQEWLSKPNEKLWQDFDPSALIMIINQKAFNELSVSEFKRIKFLPAENSPLDFFLQQNKHGWNQDLSLTFFDRLKTWLKSSEATHWGDWHIRKVLAIAGLLVPSKLYPKISREWPEHLPVWGGWERDISGSLMNLELRYKMEKSLMEN